MLLDARPVHAHNTFSTRCQHTPLTHISRHVQTSHMACQMQRSIPHVYT